MLLFAFRFTMQSIKSPALQLDSHSPWWLEDVPTNHLDLVVTLSRSRLPCLWVIALGTSSPPRLLCLRVIALWTDTRKEWDDHLANSAGDADPPEEEQTAVHFLCQCPSLARCRHWLFGHHLLSACGSYHLLISWIKLHL